MSCVGSRETSDAIASVHSTFNCKSSDFVHSILGQILYSAALICHRFLVVTFQCFHGPVNSMQKRSHKLAYLGIIVEDENET